MATDSESISASDEYTLTHEKTSGFDASPNAERAETNLSRRTTRTLDPRSALNQLRNTETHTFTHPLTNQPTSIDALVSFDGPNDPYKPINWNHSKKVITVVLYGFTAMGSSFGSAVFSSAISSISEEYHVSNVVATLGVTLFMLGFGLGPLLWAPLSEVFGRRMAVFPPYFIGICFTFATACSKDLQSIMITRFFAGFFSSAPVTNTGGVLGDLFSPEHRAMAMAGYSMSVIGGPLLSPIVGGAIITTGTSWRWTEYVTGILMSVVLVADILVLDESFSSTLLVFKARKLRQESGNWAIHAKHEEWDVTISELAHKYLLRPFQLLATPICACMATYASFVYAIVYTCFIAFPIEFEQERGWNPLVGALPFLATLIGCILGAGLNLLNTRFYVAKLKANNGKPVPEARLPPMMAGSIIFPAGLFIFGWTSSKDIPWIATCIGAALIGCGFLTIFQAALNYIIDTFQVYAASAVGANTALRSLLAGVFPLFASAMFHNLGIDWAASLIGFVAVVMIPFPFLFYIYGRRIRERGEWSRDSTL